MLLLEDMKENEAIFILKVTVNAVRPTLDCSETGHLVARFALPSCIIVRFLFIYFSISLFKSGRKGVEMQISLLNKLW